VAEQIKYTPNHFNEYRFVRTVSLSKLNKMVQTGTVVEFDGTTLRLDGEDHNYPTFRAAIRDSFVVPIDSEVMVSRPEPANIRMREATPKGMTREVVNRTAGTPSVDESTVGSYKDIRARKGKYEVIVEDNGDPVGRMLNPAATPPGKETLKEGFRAASVGSKSKYVLYVEPLVQTNGAVAFDHPSELDEFGGSKSTRGAPDRNIVTGLDSEEAEILNKFRAEREEQRRAEREEQLRAEAARKAAASVPDDHDDSDQIPMDLIDRIGKIQKVIPNFEWDVTRQWKARVADAVKRYGTKPIYLQAICSIETPAVREAIQKTMAASKS
jgi:hypothetical protein